MPQGKKEVKLKTMKGFEDLQPVFANFARVSHTAGMNFEISFALVGPDGGRLDRLSELGTSATAVVRVLLPAAFVPVLMQTLEKNYRTYESRTDAAQAEAKARQEAAATGEADSVER